MRRRFRWQKWAGSLSALALSAACATPSQAQVPALPAVETEGPKLVHGGRIPVVQVAQPTDAPPAPAPGDDVPTLAPTVVEGATTPPTTPPPAQPPAPQNTGMSSIYDSPFMSAVSDDTGYNANTATTGTVFNAPLIDVPGSIQVVTKDIIRDQGAVTLDGIVRNVPGLVLQTNGGGRGEIYNIRGFNIQGNQFRKDGFRDSSRTSREMANVERVEILRGPASVLYGSGLPAGTINLITKKPLPEMYQEATLQAGSYEFYRATLDSTGPVNESGDVLYRLNMAGQLSDSFRDEVFVDRAFVAPVVTWVIDSDTVFTVAGEYLYDERVMDRGVVSINGQTGVIPISRFLGEPNDIARFKDGQVTAFLDRKINDEWYFRAGWCSNFSNELRENSDNRSVNNANGNLTRAFVIQDTTDEQAHFFIGNLTGEIETGALHHQLLVGTELGYDDFSNRSASSNTAVNPYIINIYNPIYGQPRPALPAFGTSYTKNDLYGVYFQDLISVGDHWKFLLGGRHDQSDRLNRSGATTQNFESSAYTQRYGVVYQPIPETLAIYGMYAESFNPLNGLVFPGTALEPETGTIWEMGIKADIDESFSVTLAAFDIERQNTSFADPAHSGFNLQYGEIRSKGFEALAVGQITEKWSIIANCAYVDARIVNDINPANIDLRVISTPYFTDSIWTRYNLVQTNERVFGVALGFMHVGNREGNNTRNGAFDLPQYDRWDAAIYYTQGRVDLALNIENILDEEYYVGSQNATNITPGAPTSALVTMRYRY